MTIESITQELVQHLFDYRDGELYWRVKPSNKVRIHIGQKAGTLNIRGYFSTKINRKLYFNHRLIFLMHYGYLPDYLDHIDGNRVNNKVENLREATLSQNQHNRKLSKNNTSGVKGVSWQKNKWRVQIRVNDKLKSFGSYNDLELAEIVAQEVRTKYHGAFANHG